ncbi:MAG TPA: hypothetical protein VK777_16885 [Reyranella sp.]|jgi:hypothetical protein|nr:hypothetical protein [Reyranella sp.]
MTTVDNLQALPVSGPRAPDISKKQLLTQFRADIYGKEVQDAVTYSYVWLADQMGHVCLGIVINFILTYLLKWLLGVLGLVWSWDKIGVLLIGTAIVAFWEFCAFRSAVKSATGLFTLDRKLLRDNAIIAAAYMVLGVAIGYAFQLPEYGLRAFLVLVLLGILPGAYWLRQKIIWQKAALPYLFRLADAQRTIDVKNADALQKLINEEAPPAKPPRQVVIGGPIGSGRSGIAAGIGTEFAFKKAMVRYMSLAALLEFAALPPKPLFADDPGPKNIGYWRWSEAQVIIIDDIGPLIAARDHAGTMTPEQFKQVLENGLGAIVGILAQCHTVWVLGDLRAGGDTAIKGSTLDEFAAVIAGFCRAIENALVIELSAAPEADQQAVAPTKSEGTPRPALVREVMPRM